MGRPRATAIASGLKRYFTGKPCKHGHVSERFTSTGACIECDSQWQKANRKPGTGSERFRLWREKNKDRKREQDRNWRRDNKERVREIQAKSHKKWRANNLQKERARISHNRAARKLVEGTYSADDLQRIKLAQKNKCAICRVPLHQVIPHIDHIIPIASGGSNYPSNIQFLCAACNLSKGCKDPIEFAQSKGLLL
jgi:5-methylcytosine-specific restriction endonuclease McrA